MPKKIRVRVSWLSRSVWLCKWAGGLVVKLERTKTGLIRVRSIYFSGNQASMAASFDRLHVAGFEFKAERRDSVYCNGNQEYRLSGKVGMMQQIEQFILTRFLQKQTDKVVQFATVGNCTVSIA